MRTGERGWTGDQGRAGPLHLPRLRSRCAQAHRVGGGACASATPLAAGVGRAGARRYLVQGAYAGLEDHVGVEQEGAQEGLRVAGQLCDDANEQQVHVQRVLQHVLQLG